MRVRVVGLGVRVDDAVVDGLVNKRMLVIKPYDLFNPKTGVTDVVRVWRTNVGKRKRWLTPIDRYDQTSE